MPANSSSSTPVQKQKLDMTVNFITVEELEESVYNLKANMMLEDLYFTGNTCCEWSGYRQYVIAHLPQVKQLDGKLVIPMERIKARQQLPRLQQELEAAAEAARHKRLMEAGMPVSEGAYTKESRNEMYLELAEQKEEKERNERRRMGTEPKEPRVVPGIYNARGEIRQCNEGKYDFEIDDTTHPDKIVFELGVPKYLDTTALDVDVNPLYVRVVVKDKVTQLKLPYEVKPDSSKVQRSRTTGRLHIEMPLVDPRKVRDKKVSEPELEPLKPAKEPTPARSSNGYAGSDAQQAPSKAVSLQGIYKDPRRVAKDKNATLLREVKTTRTAQNPEDDDDDDEIPPLESRR